MPRTPKAPGDVVRVKAPKRKVQRLPSGRAKGVLRSMAVTARKNKFLKYLESVSGNIAQAVALYNESGDHINHGQPYEWAKTDPDFADRIIDAKSRVPGKLKTLATAAIVKGIQNGDAAFTKLGLQYAKALEPETQVNVQVNTVSLADVLSGKAPVDTKTESPKTDTRNPDLFSRVFNDAAEEV